jgi:glycosyltransferase involved in cell wall biosynthesis
MAEISIIVVTHNSGEYIEPCLDSIFAQEVKNYEVIVIDNGSQDRTKSIIKSKYPDTVLIENSQNFGSSQARNQGIWKAAFWAISMKR